MFARILDPLRTAPRTLADRGQQIRRSARDRVHATRREGSVRLWTWQIDALERVEGLLDKAPKIPVITSAANRLVHHRMEAATALPIADYDTLNAKAIVAELAGLQLVDLLRVRRHEAATKARKTVLDAVEKRLERDATVAA